jgi:hypothetical protein
MTTDPKARQAFITGLRSLARFLATHPGVPVPEYGNTILMPALGSDAEKRHEVEAFAAAAGATLTESRDGRCQASRSFGPVVYETYAVPAAEMDAYHALMSYSGNVTADTLTEKRQVA